MPLLMIFAPFAQSLLRRREGDAHEANERAKGLEAMLTDAQVRNKTKGLCIIFLGVLSLLRDRLSRYVCCCRLKKIIQEHPFLGNEYPASGIHALPELRGVISALRKQRCMATEAQACPVKLSQMQFCPQSPIILGVYMVSAITCSAMLKRQYLHYSGPMLSAVELLDRTANVSCKRSWT